MVFIKTHKMLLGGMTSYNVIAYVIYTTLLWSHVSVAEPVSDKYMINFPEEQEPGTVVADLAEIFSLRPGEIAGRTFEILGQRMMSGHKVIATDGDWLEIDRATGEISVKSPVDRETECGEDDELECVILLQTAMMPQAHFQMQNFELVVTDINDHSPKFPDPGLDKVFSLNVSEDIPEITKIKLDQFLATDEDTGDNARIYYSISRNDNFGLNQFKDDTGAPHLELVVIKQLDYEDKKTFDLTLTAKDRGSPTSRSSQVFLRVNVIDANDNYPTFEEPEYNLELRENLPEGHVITTVVARDIDTGSFGQIRYFIPKAGNSVTVRRMIDVDPETGVVKLLQPLDRETRDNIRIVIGARDQAREDEGGSKTGKTVLNIHVADVNDNAPRIHVNVILKGRNKAAYVPEDAPLGTYVAHVSATDADNGRSGVVSFSLTTILDRGDSNSFIDTEATNSRELSEFSSMSEVNDHFILKSDNLIATNINLDREVHDKYLLIVTACDGGNPQKCARKNVSVVLMDTNDNAPKFRTNQNSFTLSEDTQVGTYVTSVIAYDDDALNTPAMAKLKEGEFTESHNGEVRYSLSGAGAVFAIESKTGRLTLVGALDYEVKKMWKLTVRAQDLGNPPRKTDFTINVRVRDINDNRPEFSTPAVANSTVYATILEDRNIVLIKAIDRDTGNNAKVWYSITSEDGDKRPHRFILDPVTGSLRLNSSNKLQELIGQHVLTITARDKGSPPQEAETRLFVEVTDLPLSAIIPNYKENEEASESSRITVIVLASLASATVLLLLVLACIVVKCRKENKEIRTYNCRAAETKSGRNVSCPSKSTLSQVGSVDEVIVVNTPGQITTTKDVHFGRAMAMNRSRSMTLNDNRPDTVAPISAKYATTQRGPATFSTFSMARKTDTPNDSTNIVPSSHTDRDSGKGESDKDSDSYGGEKDNQGSEKNSQAPSESSYSQYCSGYLNELGPRCTISCRRYGHSDECWMPVVAHCEIHGEHDSFVYSDAASETSDNAYNNKNYTEHYIPSVNSLPPRYGNFDNSGLETISETQPLRVVLDSGKNPDQSSMYSYDSHSQRDYPVYLDSHNDRYYSPHQYYEENQPSYPAYNQAQAHYPLLPEQSDWRDMYRPKQPQMTPLAQTQFVGSYPEVQPRQVHRSNSSVSAKSANSYRTIENTPDRVPPVSSSRSPSIGDSESRLDTSAGSVSDKVKRFSQSIPRRPSLRDHVLNTRFIAQNGEENDSENKTDPSIEEALLRDVQNDNHNNDFQASNGEVSLEETQRIISDIDNLIAS